MTFSRIKLIAAIGATAVAFGGVGVGAALADNPHAGNSGHFKGSANPCPQNTQQCPPHND